MSQSPNDSNSVQWSSIFTTHFPTFQHIPKGARNAWAILVDNVFTSINKNFSDSESWRKLFMLPHCILSNPVNGHRLHWDEILKSRIDRWQSGDIDRLWSDYLDTVRSLKGPKSVSTISTNVRRAKRATEAGQYSKAIQALTSDGLALPTPDILDEMLAKHPQSPLPPTLPSPGHPPPKISKADVIRALKSFPSDSAPGPSLFRANHFKEAVFSPSSICGDKALAAITCTVNLLCEGRAPPEVIPHLCGATLLASVKKSGGHRPIAVGEVLRRLTSKCLSRAVQSDAV